MIKEYDVIIIGGGAAGLTAAIYIARRALKTLVLAKDLGGQASLTREIENYPGRDLVGGFELMNDFKKQAERFGAEFLLTEVEKVKKDKNGFLIITTKQPFKAKAVILAFGLTPKDLGVPGEEQFKNKGVSYCATCDGPLFKNKTVVVVGSGNSSLDAAEYLSHLASKVYLVNYRDIFRGEEILIQRVKERKNIEVLLETMVEEIKGENSVSGVVAKNKITGEKINLVCRGVFIEIGYVAKTDWVKNLVALDEKKQIKINQDCETSEAGIFAAGDVTNISYKQVVISAGEGAKAALQAYKYLQENNGKTAKVDWGKIK